MKNLLFLAFSLFLLASCGGAGGASSVAGTWQLDSVSGEELTESEKEAIIEFKADGTMIRKRGDQERKGTWAIEKEGENQVIVIKGEKGSEQRNVIQELTASKLAFKVKSGDIVTLKKK